MEKRNLIYPVVIGLIVIGFFSCIVAFAIETSTHGTNNIDETVIVETRDVKDFNKVNLLGVANLEIIQGDTESLTITASKSQIANAETYVKDKTLYLKDDKNENIRISLFSFNFGPEISYKLTVKDLQNLKTEGTGNIEINSLTVKDISFEIIGIGNLSVNNLSAEKVNLNSEGTGNTNITGKANTLTLSMSGIGDFNGEDFIVNDITAISEGTGNATVNATTSLDITLSGVGNLEYYGNPKVSKNIDGIGNVEKANE